mgnify:CR=1 FL=1
MSASFATSVRFGSTFIGAPSSRKVVYALNASTRQLLFFVLPSIVTEYQLTPEMTGIVSAIVTVSAGACGSRLASITEEASARLSAVHTAK